MCGTAGWQPCYFFGCPNLTRVYHQLSNWLVNFTVALTAPLFLRASPSGPYFFFGSATLFTTIVCIFLMPEIKGKSLEEIEELFEMAPGEIISLKDV
jgi:hypothetical protein